MATKEKKRLTPVAPASVFADDTPWTTYMVELSFTGRLYGGNPFDPELVEGWLRSKLGITDEEELRAWMRKHLAETQGLDPTDINDEAIAAAIEQNAAEKKAQGFKRTPDNHPYIEGRHVKAMINGRAVA